MPRHTQIQHGNDHTQPAVVIHLDTADASLINTSKSRFTLVLREPLESNSYHEIMVFSLHNLVIPFSFYNVRSEVNNDILVDGLQRSLTEGYYSFYDDTPATPNSVINPFWKTELDTLLTPLTFTLDPRRRKLVITNPDVAPHTISWGGVAGSVFRNTAYMLGLDSETTDTITIAPAGVFTAPFCMDERQFLKQIKIKTSLPTSRYYDNKGGGTNTFGTANIGNTLWGEVITTANQPFTDHSQACDIQSVSEIEIELTDEQDFALTLNGLSWSVDIQAEFKPKLDFRRTGTAFTKRGTTGNTDIASAQRLAYHNQRNINKYMAIANKGSTAPPIPRGLPILNT